MAKLTLTDISANRLTSLATINANNALIEAALENTLSRDGTTPNEMGADLDMNSNKILNLVTPTSNNEPATKYYVDNNVGVLSNSGIVRAEDYGTTQLAGEAAINKIFVMPEDSTITLSVGSSGALFTDLQEAFDSIRAWSIPSSSTVKITLADEVYNHTGEQILARGNGSRVVLEGLGYESSVSLASPNNINISGSAGSWTVAIDVATNNFAVGQHIIFEDAAGSGNPKALNGTWEVTASSGSTVTFLCTAQVTITGTTITSATVRRVGSVIKSTSTDLTHSTNPNVVDNSIIEVMGDGIALDQIGQTWAGTDTTAIGAMVRYGANVDYVRCSFVGPYKNGLWSIYGSAGSFVNCWVSGISSSGQGIVHHVNSGVLFSNSIVSGCQATAIRCRDLGMGNLNGVKAYGCVNGISGEGWGIGLWAGGEIAEMTGDHIILSNGFRLQAVGSTFTTPSSITENRVGIDGSVLITNWDNVEGPGGVSEVLTGSIASTAYSVPATGDLSIDVTVTGVTVADDWIVTVSFDGEFRDSARWPESIQAFVNADDTVRVRIRNENGTAINVSRAVYVKAEKLA